MTQRSYAFRLDDGEQLYGGITGFVEKQHITAGSVVVLSGMVRAVRLRLPSTAGDPKILELPGPLSIICVTGNVSIHRSHIHVGVEDPSGQLYGGHLLREGNTVHGAVKVGLLADDRLVFGSEHDPATGYDEQVVLVRRPQD